MIFTWLIYPVLESLFQGWKFNTDPNFGRKSKKDPFYLILFFIRGIIAIVFGGAVLDMQPDLWYAALAMVGFQAGSFWIIFDPLLNLWRGKRFAYEGKNSGWLSLVPYWLQLIISIVICTISYLALNNLGY